jgi:hypothetical protein
LVKNHLSLAEKHDKFNQSLEEGGNSFIFHTELQSK